MMFGSPEMEEGHKKKGKKKKDNPHPDDQGMEEGY